MFQKLKNITHVLILILILFFLFSFLTQPIFAAQDDILINELMVYPADGEDEWIEFFNASDTDSYDLSGMWIAVNQGPENNYTYHYLYNLSSAVPRNGFLTFTFSADETARLPDDGACISIFIAENSSVFSMKYGNGTCDAGVDAVDATAITIEQGKSINAKESWQMGTPPPTATWSSTSGTDITKGWCSNANCPAISTIVSQLSAEDVATNLGSQSDYSRVSGLYFEKSQNSSALGRITFSSQMNLTDQDALTWLQQLNDELAISQGVISLDTDLIEDLTITQASLIMDNITLNNPIILVDGLTDSQNIVSGLTYDTTAHTLTFTAAHFTTFTASEYSSSASSGSSPPGPSVCNNLPPLFSPDLFHIDATSTTATLYFTPVNNYMAGYYIAYGLSLGDNQYGVEFPAKPSSGAIPYTIKALAPDTTYYYSVRAGNGCATGPWSNWLSAKTKTSILGIVSVPTPTPTPTPPLASISTPTSESQPNPIPSPASTPTPSPPPPTLPFWQKITNLFKSFF